MASAAICAELGFSELMFSSSTLIGLLQERASGAGLWAPQAHSRGAELLSQGQPCDQVLVLTSGLAKLTYGTAAGDEWIKSFIVDEGVFDALEGGTSRFGAFAIEPCLVSRLPLSWLQNLIASDPLVATEAAAFSGWLARRKQQREEALLCDTAEARYRRMLVDEPRLLARLPQGDIARYLRVTPIAFSRIKRRLRGTTTAAPRAVSAA